MEHTQTTCAKMQCVIAEQAQLIRQPQSDLKNLQAALNNRDKQIADMQDAIEVSNKAKQNS